MRTICILYRRFDWNIESPKDHVRLAAPLTYSPVLLRRRRRMRVRGGLQFLSPQCLFLAGAPPPGLQHAAAGPRTLSLAPRGGDHQSSAARNGAIVVTKKSPFFSWAPTSSVNNRYVGYHAASVPANSFSPDALVAFACGTSQTSMRH